MIKKHVIWTRKKNCEKTIDNCAIKTILTAYLSSKLVQLRV